MGNLLGSGNAEDEEEELEQERLKRWRPAGEQQGMMPLWRRKAADKNSDAGSEEGSASGGGGSDDLSNMASSVGDPQSEDSDEGKASLTNNDLKAAAAGPHEEDRASSEGTGADRENEDMEQQIEDLRKKKFVVRMEFEPLLSLHEPLSTWMEEPASIWEKAKGRKKTHRREKAAHEEAVALNRRKAKAMADWMASMALEDCMLQEAADALGEDPDELRFSLVTSKHFEVDGDGVVRKTLIRAILDVMTADIETVREVIDKLVDFDADEDIIRSAAKDSHGELRYKTANDVPLLERVNVDAELKQQRLDEKEQRLKAREARRKLQQQQQRQKRRGSLGSHESAATASTDAEGDDDSSSSSAEGGEIGNIAVNKAAAKKALAFRRLQVQRKIEDFLRQYSHGQNLQKINAKGRRFNRRVYVDTAKKALVVQGASGPSFFPFVNMREVDIDTHTSKEGRLETHVICAMEKNGRIYKELNLAFPEQAKANNFVNCVTLFSLALRTTPK